MKIKFLDLGDQLISIEKLIYIKKLEGAHSGMVYLELCFDHGIRSERGFESKEKLDKAYKDITEFLDKYS